MMKRFLLYFSFLVTVAQADFESVMHERSQDIFKERRINGSQPYGEQATGNLLTSIVNTDNYLSGRSSTLSNTYASKKERLEALAYLFQRGIVKKNLPCKVRKGGQVFLPFSHEEEADPRLMAHRNALEVTNLGIKAIIFNPLLALEEKRQDFIEETIKIATRKGKKDKLANLLKPSAFNILFPTNLLEVLVPYALFMADYKGRQVPLKMVMAHTKMPHTHQGITYNFEFTQVNNQLYVTETARSVDSSSKSSKTIYYLLQDKARLSQLQRDLYTLAGIINFNIDNYFYVPEDRSLHLVAAALLKADPQKTYLEQISIKESLETEKKIIFPVNPEAQPVSNGISVKHFMEKGLSKGDNPRKLLKVVKKMVPQAPSVNEKVEKLVKYLEAFIKFNEEQRLEWDLIGNFYDLFYKNLLILKEERGRQRIKLKEETLELSLPTVKEYLLYQLNTDRSFFKSETIPEERKSTLGKLYGEIASNSLVNTDERLLEFIRAHYSQRKKVLIGKKSSSSDADEHSLKAALNKVSNGKTLDEKFYDYLLYLSYIPPVDDSKKNESMNVTQVQDSLNYKDIITSLVREDQLKLLLQNALTASSVAKSSFFKERVRAYAQNIPLLLTMVSLCEDIHAAALKAYDRAQEILKDGMEVPPQ